MECKIIYYKNILELEILYDFFVVFKFIKQLIPTLFNTNNYLYSQTITSLKYN
jgi:hypothetical protein